MPPSNPYLEILERDNERMKKQLQELEGSTEKALPAVANQQQVQEQTADWPQRLGVYLFSLGGFEYLSDEEKQTCRDAAEWARQRVGEWRQLAELWQRETEIRDKQILEKSAELAAVQADRDRLAKDYDTLRRAINDNSGECSPGCNSYGHTEDCEYLDDAATMRIQQEKIDALRSELSSLRSTSLTPEEAQQVLDTLRLIEHESEVYPAVRAKLRKSSEPQGS